MPPRNLVDNFFQLFEQFKKFNFEELKEFTAKFSPWNELTIDDVENRYNEIIKVIQYLNENDILEILPFNILNSIVSTLRTINTHYSNLLNQRNQQHFHNFVSQIESFRTNLYNWGLFNLAVLSPNLPEITEGVNAELKKLYKANDEVTKLRKEINSLITPAIAGTLALSFSKRKKFIFWGRIVFLVLFIISLFIASYYTVDLIQKIANLYEKFSKTNNSFAEIPTYYFILRTAALIPIYTIVTFFGAQYSKERNMEELYAHKETIASSLKTYGDLIHAPELQDQIFANASEVVFTNPVARDKSIKKSDTELRGLPNILKLLKDISEKLSKFSSTS